MYKLILWRHGKQIIEEYESRAEANKQFNFVSEYEIGFSECILDQNNRVVRDGKQNVFGIKKEKRIGSIYPF